MPKTPSSRVSFCKTCEVEIPWGDTSCARCESRRKAVGRPSARQATSGAGPGVPKIMLGVLIAGFFAAVIGLVIKLDPLIWLGYVMGGIAFQWLFIYSACRAARRDD